MARPTSRDELITVPARAYEKFREFAASVTENELEAPSSLSANKGKKEAH